MQKSAKNIITNNLSDGKTPVSRGAIYVKNSVILHKKIIAKN